MVQWHLKPTSQNSMWIGLVDIINDGDPELNLMATIW